MRPLFVLLLILLIARICGAQSQYAVAPAPPAPQPTWGGYAMPTQVPYQPTLEGAPVVMSPADPNQVWQAYPGQAPAMPMGQQPIGTAPMSPPDAVYLDGAPPGVTHEMPPGEPLYPGSTEPSLRESLTPIDARNGFFQKIRLTADVLPSFGNDNLGWTDFGVDLVTAL